MNSLKGKKTRCRASKSRWRWPARSRCKAGKSTVVNAIIRTEALPNRARPMTALPTVIRDKSDRFEPGLTINNAAALNGLADRIACKLQDEARLDAVRRE